MKAGEISKALSMRVETLVPNWYPLGKREGGEWRVGSVQGDAGRSLAIRMSGERAGIWSDFATGQKGDMLDLWCVRFNVSLREAISEAKKLLGVSSPEFHSFSPKKYKKPVNTSPLVPENSAVMRYLIEERKLTVDTIERFQLRAQGREILFPYWRDKTLLNIKAVHLDRPNGKKQVRVASGCEPCLFGWQALPSHTRTITLTEGEIDAMTLSQWGIPALSLPFGGGVGAKHQWLAHEFENLSHFDEIYLCFDTDETGRATTIELLNRLGSYRCRVVNLPCKDANECLQRGITQDEILACFANSNVIAPEELQSASLFCDAVLQLLYPSPEDASHGLQPPLAYAKGRIAFRPNELSIWTGTNGHGKSQFLGQVALDGMKKGAKVCIASLEMSPARLLTRMARQATALATPSEEYVRALHMDYSEKLWICNMRGSVSTTRLLDIFSYARQRYGVTIFILDSLMKCGLADDDYAGQKKFVEELCDFKNQHPCHIHLVVHPRKAIDEDQIPNKLDMKGTGSITDLADNCFCIWRNKAKERAIALAEYQQEEPDEKVREKMDGLWICDKQRNGEWEGKIRFWFHPPSFQYLDHPHSKPRPFMVWSQLTPEVKS